MRYRVTQSEEDSKYTVYRTFNYTGSKYRGAQGFLSIFLLSLGIYLTIPTPEDVVILGTLGKYISGAFDLSAGKGILYATLTYKGIGVALLCAAMILGGAYIRGKLKSKVKKQMDRFSKLHLF